MAKKRSIRREILGILQAAAAVITARSVPTQENGGIRLSDLVKKVSEATKMSVDARQLIKAMKVWFDQNLARFNNRFIHLTDKGYNEIRKLVPASG